MVDNEHENVRYMYENLSQSTGVPLVLLIFPIYNDDGTCVSTLQDWNAMCARETIELIVTCTCNRDMETFIAILTNDTSDSDIK